MLNKINFDSKIVLQIIRNILKTTPGVDMDKPIEINTFYDGIQKVVICFHSKNEIINIYDLAIKIQELVYFKLIRDLDLNKLSVIVVVN